MAPPASDYRTPPGGQAAHLQCRGVGLAGAAELAQPEERTAQPKEHALIAALPGPRQSCFEAVHRLRQHQYQRCRQ